jgi:hypothetical protein
MLFPAALLLRLLALLPSFAPPHPSDGPAGMAAARDGRGNLRIGPNWAMGNLLSYAHVVEAHTIFYAGLAPAPSGRVRRLAVWPGLVTEMDGYVMQAYAVQSEEDYFYKEYVGA